jgi:hypothetical protein
MNRKQALVVVLTVVIVIAFIIVFMHQLRTERADQSYFFFQDPDFLDDSKSLTKKWFEWVWQGQLGSFSNITDGLGWVKIVEDTGINWSSAAFIQGRMPHDWANWQKLLSGKTLDTAKPAEGVKFHRDFAIPSGRFFLQTKVKMMNRTFLANVSEGMGGVPQGDIGIALMCSFEYIGEDGKIYRSDYEIYDPTKPNAVHIDIYFSNFRWNGSTFYPVRFNNLFDTPYDKDYHIAITVQNQITQVDVWHEITVDMAEIFSKSFDLINTHGWGPKNVVAITVHGVQVYVDGIGISLEAQYDYIKTIVKS